MNAENADSYYFYSRFLQKSALICVFSVQFFKLSGAGLIYNFNAPV